jgi:hypothetical protein
LILQMLSDGANMLQELLWSFDDKISQK